MFNEQEKTLIFKEISGRNAKSVIEKIILHDRGPGTTGFSLAAQSLLKELKSIGVNKSKIIKVPVKKGQKYLAWNMNKIWECKYAEIDLLDIGNDGFRVNTLDEPISIFSHSASTPKDGIKTEIVYLPTLSAENKFKGLKLEKKVVMIGVPSFANIYNLVVKKKVKGIITTTPGLDDMDYPDKILKYGFRGKDVISKKPIGFSIARRQFESLKKEILKKHKQGEKSFVNVKVDAKFKEGYYEIVEGFIPGKTHNKEIILIAHLCHMKPSANDNASGCAVIVEMVRAILKLIKEKKLPLPDGDIRILFPPEWVGTIAWIDKYMKKNKFVTAVISPDMVGEDQLKCGSILQIVSPPYSLPSPLPDLINEELEWASNNWKKIKLGRKDSSFVFKRHHYEGGSDNMPFVADYPNIPAVALDQLPDYFYHSNLDTLDKVDPNVLEKVGVAIISTTYKLLSNDVYTIIDMMNYSLRASRERLISQSQKYSQMIINAIRKKQKKEQVYTHIYNSIDGMGFFTKHAVNVLKAFLPLINNLTIKNHRDKLLRMINKLSNDIVILNDSLQDELIYLCSTFGYDARNKHLVAKHLTDKVAKEAAKIIVKKRIVGAWHPWYAASDPDTELMNEFIEFLGTKQAHWSTDITVLWAERGLSALRIYKNIQHEFLLYKDNMSDDLKDFMQFLKYLEKMKIVKLKRRK